MKANAASAEFDAFSRLVDKVLSVSHDEIKQSTRNRRTPIRF